MISPIKIGGYGGVPPSPIQTAAKEDWSCGLNDHATLGHELGKVGIPEPLAFIRQVEGEIVLRRHDLLNILGITPREFKGCVVHGDLAKTTPCRLLSRG